MQTKKLAKTDVEGFARDLDTRAVLNTNTEEYKLYKSRRDREKQIANILVDVNDLKSDLTEIKNLLVKMVGNING